jgi:Oxygenase domain of the 2OGFeDO superfamily
MATQQRQGSSRWLKIIEDPEKFINLALSLIHPALFESGLLMLGKLRQLEATKDVAEDWQSVYNGISVVSNRESPPHRDSGGRPEWYDTLINYTGPGGNPRLELKDLGMDLEYSSGTAVSFCGMILEHEVKQWGGSDRVCYAHFMKELIRRRLDVPAAGWVEQSMYLPRQI